MTRATLLAALALSATLASAGQPAVGADADWPTYHGTFDGQRHSPLDQISRANVAGLGLAWVYHATLPADAGGFLKPSLKSNPVMRNGILYFSMPNHVWAIDARTGREVWHHATRAGTAIGHRGVALHGNSVLTVTPDNHLLALDAGTGKEQWRVEIADVKLGYVSTMAPLVIGDRVIVGAGGDSLDLPGELQARDARTGALLWRWRTTPRPGEPGSETWPNADAMEHGAGMPWITGTYDPELKLVYWGTGNPNPVHAGQGRAGDNLWTCTIVALDVETGRLVWHYQVSPHDTHDWDAVQTPVLVDGEVAGVKRRLLIQASRNGYFFVLDRATGEHLMTTPFAAVNWAKGLDAQGRPIADPVKEPRLDGTLVVPSSGGAANWPPPSFDPTTGLLYVPSTETYSIYYLTDASPKPSGFGGRDEFMLPQPGITAIDWATGAIRWRHAHAPGLAMAGLLSTAGGVLIAGDSQQNLLALDSTTGRTLWHVNLGAAVGNAPITYSIDGRQFLVVAAGMDLYGFTLPETAPAP